MNIEKAFFIEGITINTEDWNDAMVNAAIKHGIAAVLAPKIRALRSAERRLATAVKEIQKGEF